MTQPKSTAADGGIRASTVVHEFDLRRLAPGRGCRRSPLERGVPAIRLSAREAEAGLALRAPGAWARAKYLCIEACCEGEHLGNLHLRFYARGAKEPRFNVSLGLFPRLPARVTFPLAALDAQRVFLPRTPGRLKAVCFGSRLGLDEISHARLSLLNTLGKQRLCLRRVALLSREPAYPLPDRKVVDELGQWTGKSWPGKTADATALKRQLRAAAKSARRASFPSAWSAYGGARGLAFRATGFFRVEHDGARWWLVDPDGRGFFSAGMDCVVPGESSAVTAGMEKLLAWLPEAPGPYADAANVTGGRGPRTVSFGRANLIRVFGRRWYAQWAALARGRLCQWRFNTVANWSDLKFARQARLPYVLPLPGFPATAAPLFRDFPDVFAPAYRRAARKFAGYLRDFRDDRYLIGYFLRNEPLWGFGTFNLAAEMLEAHPGSFTRKELARWVERKYRGDVQAWAKAWRLPLKSFAQLETEVFRRIGEGSPAAHENLWEFSKEMVRAYVRIPSEETRKAAPHHLNLGMRFAWIASELLYCGAECYDVFSLNCYGMTPPHEAAAEIARRMGKPVLIGEYHFGALDRGLPATGLRGVASQVERGVAYRRYFEACAADPHIVGAHYFQLNDQGVLGRFDGENFQIGFVDCCHTPYAELTRQAARAHERMYAVRLGKVSAFPQAAREIPRIGF